MKSILCYGDSNTYGHDPRNSLRYKKELRWTTILQNLLGEDYEVINEGLNGRTTAYNREDGAYMNGYTHLLACFATHKPVDYLIIMLGTNDCNKELHLTSNDIANGLEKLINLIENEGTLLQDIKPKIVIVTPACISEDYKTSPYFDQLDEESVKKSHEIEPLYKELARKHNCLYLDCSDLEVSSLDSEHLTIDAHNELAHRLANLLKN